MTFRRFITPAAIALAVTAPLWIGAAYLPVLPGIVTIVFSVMAFPLEIMTALLLVMAMVEQKRWPIFIAAAVGIVGGGIMQLSIPHGMGLMLQVVKALLPPLLMGGLVAIGWRAGKALVLALIVITVLVTPVYWPMSKIIETSVDDHLTALDKEMMLALQYDGDSTGVAVADSTATTADESSEKEQKRQTLRRLLQQAGYNEKMWMVQKDGLVNFSRLVVRFTPGALLMFGMMPLILGFFLAEFIYTRRDGFFPGFGSFIYWKTPEYLLFLVAAAIIVRLFSGGTVQMIADNLLLIIAVFYTVTGLSFIEHLLKRLRLPLYIKVLFYVGLTLMFFWGLIGVAAVGLCDSFFDWRKIKAHRLG